MYLLTLHFYAPHLVEWPLATIMHRFMDLKLAEKKPLLGASLPWIHKKVISYVPFTHSFPSKNPIEIGKKECNPHSFTSQHSSIYGL